MPIALKKAAVELASAVWTNWATPKLSYTGLLMQARYPGGAETILLNAYDLVLAITTSPCCSLRLCGRWRFP